MEIQSRRVPLAHRFRSVATPTAVLVSLLALTGTAYGQTEAGAIDTTRLVVADTNATGGSTFVLPVSPQRSGQQSGLASPLSLSGLPGYARLDVAVPRDIDVSDAWLDLLFDVDLDERATSTLRWSVDGERRGERVLHQADRTLHLTVPLTEADRADGQVRLTLATVGDLGGGICRSTRDSGVVVTLRPDSRFLVETDTVTDLSVRDAWAMRPALVPVAAQSNGLSVAQLDLVMSLQRAGIDARAASLAEVNERGGIVLVTDVEDVIATQGNLDRPVLAIDADRSAVATRLLTNGAIDFAEHSTVRLSDGDVADVASVADVPASLLDLVGADLDATGTSQLRWRVDLPWTTAIWPAPVTGFSLDIDTSAALPNSWDIINVSFDGQPVGGETRPAGTSGPIDVTLPDLLHGVGGEMTVTLDRVQQGLPACPHDWPTINATIDADSVLNRDDGGSSVAAGANFGLVGLVATAKDRDITVSFDRTPSSAELTGLAELLAVILPPETVLASGDQSADIDVDFDTELTVGGIANAGGARVTVTDGGDRLLIEGDASSLSGLVPETVGRLVREASVDIPPVPTS